MLGVYTGARMSEVIRAGILAIPRTQFEASLAMGLSDPFDAAAAIASA